MNLRSRLAGILGSATLVLLPACTIVRVEDAKRQPQIRGEGLIDGYVGVGVPEIGAPLDVTLFGSGISFGVNILNLLRVEIGALGFALGVGPLQAGLGTLFYEPEPLPYPEPEVIHVPEEPEPAPR